MGAFFRRKGFAAMLICAAVSYAVMRLQSVYGSVDLSEWFMGTQTVLLIAAWVTGLLTAGGFLFWQLPFTGILKVLCKTAGMIASAAFTLLVVWFIVRFANSGASVAGTNGGNNFVSLASADISVPQDPSADLKNRDYYI